LAPTGKFREENGFQKKEDNLLGNTPERKTRRGIREPQISAKKKDPTDGMRKGPRWNDHKNYKSSKPIGGRLPPLGKKRSRPNE